MALVAVVIAIIAPAFYGGNTFGASGTRFPNGLSTNSTSPAVGELQTTTLEVDSTSSFEGALSALSTLSVTGATTLSATTSAVSIAIGSTSPQNTNGNVLILDNATVNATSSIIIRSNNGTKGACIQMEGTASTTYRVYATTTNNTTSLGTGYLVVEEGTCQ